MQDMPTGAIEYWPAEQFVQSRSEVVEKSLRHVPAAHCERGIQGAWPVKDHDAPLTHRVKMQASAVAFHTKPAVVLHAQLAWPVSVLLT